MEYLTLTEAAQRLPKAHGRKRSSHLLWRWCRRGVKARDGRRIFIDHVRLGGTIYVTAEAVDAFGRQLAQADQAHFSQTQDQLQSLHPIQQAIGVKRDSGARSAAIRNASNSLSKDNI